MGKRIKRQHVVSKFYLKGFADDSGIVRRVTLPGDTSHPLSITDAGVIKDFYTITLPDGTQSDAFEQAFSEVEAPAARALREIVAGTWPVAGDDRSALATWIALQHLRSEDMRAVQGTLNAQMIRLIVGTAGKEALRRLIEKAESRTLTSEELDWEWQDLTKPCGPDLAPNVDEHLRVLVSLLDSTRRYLQAGHWTLFVFARRSLITSDHPVSLLVEPDDSGWPAVGLATADAFLIPLTRRMALIIEPSSRIPEGSRAIAELKQPGSTRIARSMNQETADRARRYIYHHPDDSPLDGLDLPEPMVEEGQGWDIDDLIAEDGLFHHLGDKPGAESRPSESDKRSKGVTINDLPWPIPGRDNRNRPVPS